MSAMKPLSLPVSLEPDRGTIVYSMGDVRAMFTLKGSSDAEVLLAGDGYWVRVEADVVWTIDAH